MDVVIPKFSNLAFVQDMPPFPIDPHNGKLWDEFWRPIVSGMPIDSIKVDPEIYKDIF